MTTPDTAAVRAWARDNGYEISDRGRLSAEVRDAYLAAHAKAKKAAPAKRAAVKKAPAKKAAATRVVAAPAVATRVEEPTVDEQQAPGSAPVTDPRKQQSGAPEDRRLIALAEQITALTSRVEKLEKAQGSEKPSRFGLRKSR